MARKTISELNPTEFENLTFDLLQSAGLRNLVWRTPGADGGRDIEGLYHFNDLSGAVTIQKWYVECKRYAATIDWPTLWQKISYADNLDADYLLLVTNSNPSPSCETQISIWNSRRKQVQIRVWRGYEIDKILQAYPAVALKYGLHAESAPRDIGFLPLLIEIMKVTQGSYAAFEFGGDPGAGLEAAAALTELVSLRMDQVRSIGRIAPGERSVQPPDYTWLAWSGSVAAWETAGIRALLSAYRYFLGASAVDVTGTADAAQVVARECRGRLTPAVRASLVDIALWADIELERIEEIGFLMIIRPR